MPGRLRRFLPLAALTAACGAPPPAPVPPASAAELRALVRPTFQAAAARAVSREHFDPGAAAGPTMVLVSHARPDGRLEAGCVDSEDGAAALATAARASE